MIIPSLPKNQPTSSNNTNTPYQRAKASTSQRLDQVVTLEGGIVSSTPLSKPNRKRIHTNTDPNQNKKIKSREYIQTGTIKNNQFENNGTLAYYGNSGKKEWRVTGVYKKNEFIGPATLTIYNNGKKSPPFNISFSKDGKVHLLDQINKKDKAKMTRFKEEYAYSGLLS